MGEADVGDMPLRLRRLETLVESWWHLWIAVAFPLLCPRQKWTQERRNLAVGDVFLLKPDHKVGKGSYRLGRILEVHPDEEGVVRTVTLGLRKRRGGSREKATECRQCLEPVLMAVQRLVLIQPVGEQDNN